MKTATPSDFKIGAVLVDKFGGLKFRIKEREQEGVWVARIPGGEKCVFETEAACYYVE